MAGASLTVRLSRVDNTSPWGFRMQGGKDFSAPLTVNRVTPGTISANSGLLSGDVIIQVNGKDATSMRHQEAQDAIIGAGNSLSLTLKRGGSYPGYAPSPVATPTKPQAYAAPPAAPQAYAAPPAPQSYNPPAPPAPQSYNSPAAPAAPPQNYNSPSRLYGGDSLTSATQKMSIQSPAAQSARYEEPSGGSGPQYKGYTNPDVQSKSFNALKGVIDRGQDPSAYTKQAPWQSDTVNKQSDAAAKVIPSETWRMVQEQEGRGGQMPEPPPPPSAQSRPYNPQPAPDVLKAGNFTQRPGPAPQPAIGSRPGAWTPGSGGGPAAQSPKGWAPGQQASPVSEALSGGGGPGKAVRGSATVAQASVDPSKVPVCSKCKISIRGPFILALSKTWCPQHFVCAKCGCQLVNVGFVELNGQVYCEKDYEAYFAPTCARCKTAIVGETVNALEKQWHPQCFVCSQCGVPIKSGSFHVESGAPYCYKDWSQMFQTKCSGCDFAVEPGDKWVEALGKNWHAECFNCTVCQANLEGKPFVPQNGKPYCQTHARMGY